MSESAGDIPALVLFDGTCNFCCSSVNFSIRRDPRGRLRFATLSSEAARRAVAATGFSGELPDSVVLIENGRLHTLSSAGLRIAKKLRMPWPVLGVFLLLPRCVRDIPYRWLARNRYRWFGKRDECMVPTPEIRARFVL